MSLLMISFVFANSPEPKATSFSTSITLIFRTRNSYRAIINEYQNTVNNKMQLASMSIYYPGFYLQLQEQRRVLFNVVFNTLQAKTTFFKIKG